MDPALSPEQLLAHAPFVRALARALVRDDAAADDLAQDSLLAALTKPPRNPAQPGRSHSVRAWLVGVVRNLARQTKRGDERRLARESAAGRERPPPPATPREAAERLELFGRLVAAVQRLDEPIRATILRRYFDGASAQEIAAEQEIPLETVRTRIKRGLERLRAMLDETAGGRASWSAIASTVFMEAAEVTTKTKLLLVAAAAAIVTTTAAVWPVLHSGNDVGAGASSVATRSQANGANATNAVAPDSKLAAARTAEATNPPAAPSDPLATWIVRGRVHSGIDSPRPHVRIRAKLWDGFERNGEPRLDLHLASDEHGAFEWPLHPPAGAVVLSLKPEEPDSYQYGDERWVAAAAPPPQNLELHCFSLDGAIDGVVYGPDGAPAHDARVSVMHKTYDCDEKGEFTAACPSDSKWYDHIQVIGWAPGCAETMATATPGPRGATPRLELHLAPGLSVRGRITDAAGSSIAGATVSKFGLRVTQATSDAQGDYCLEHVPLDASTMTLDARAEGYAISEGQVEGGATEAHLDFVMKRGVVVRGTVRQQAGKPAAGAEVTLGFSPFDYEKLVTHSHDDGSFAIAGAKPGRAQLNLYVEWQGAASLTQPITIPNDLPDGGEIANVVLTLSATHFAAGRVHDEQGKPIAGVYVSFQKGGESQGSDGQSDAGGAFRAERLPDGPLLLRAYGNGWAETRLEEVAVDRNDFDVTMKRSGRVSGRVVDGSTGEPIRRFKIRFCSAKLAGGERQASFYDVDWSRSGKTFEDAQGRFGAGDDESMPVGSVLGLEASAEGYAPSFADHVVLRVDPERDGLVIKLLRGGAIEGLAVDASDGRPVADALVKLVSESMPFVASYDSHSNARPTTKSDEAGRFRLDRIPSGKTTLVVEHPGYATVYDDFEVPRGGTTVTRTIRLGRAGGIDGIVLDEAGTPIAGASIELQTQFNRPLSADGNFTAAELLELERAIRRNATSDVAGRFSFASLPAGRYRVTRIAQDGAARCRAVELIVVVEPDAIRQVRLGANGAAKLRGRIHGAAGLPRSLLVVMVSESSVSPGWPELRLEQRSHDDAFEFSGLPAGGYHLLATGEGWRGSFDFDLAEGATLDATVEVAKSR